MKKFRTLLRGMGVVAAAAFVAPMMTSTAAEAAPAAPAAGRVIAPAIFQVNPADCTWDQGIFGKGEYLAFWKADLRTGQRWPTCYADAGGFYDVGLTEVWSWKSGNNAGLFTGAIGSQKVVRGFNKWQNSDEHFNEIITVLIYQE
ncbi:hypothetical protein AB0M83_23740 [Amycolatopsis sp. NPDC051106]|uniref:hypothetical protein n=1 Tax=unclassified Amycolatopsis TaxID=2618356 RepID=UPI0034363CAF